jgi:hypothetical protein
VIRVTKNQVNVSPVNVIIMKKNVLLSKLDLVNSKNEL